MSAAEFKQVYDETTPKLMYAAAQRSVDGELPSGVPSGSPVAGSAAAQRSADTSKSRLPPRYVPFDLSVFDKEPEGEDDARSTEVGSEPSWESTSDSEVDNVTRAVESVEWAGAAKSMTRAQRFRLKRQQRRRRINLSRFKENVNERDELIGPDGVNSESGQVVVCELEDLQGSLEKLDQIIDAIGYIPEIGKVTEEEQRILETAGICKVTKTVLARDLEKYGLKHQEQPARDKEGNTMREFGVFGVPVEDDCEVRSLPGFNYSRTLEACAIKNYETQDPEVRFRLVVDGSDTRASDESRAVFQSIRDIPASLMEIRIVLVICRLMKFIVRQGDVVGAYLNAVAPANSFVRLGKGWLSALSEEGQRRYSELMAAGKSVLVPLLKSLYGHVLSGALWARWFAEQLQIMGWKQLRDVSDAVWVLFDGAGKLIGILAVYVDDLIVGALQETLTWFESALTRIVRLKAGLHPVGRLLGGAYRSRQWSEGHGSVQEEHEEIFISVGEYAKHIAGRYFENKTGKFAKPGRASTPADTEPCAAVPGTAPAGQHAEEAAVHVGGCMWLQRVGLPSLCTSTNAIAREMHAWSEKMDRALHRHMSWVATHAAKLGLLLYVVSGCDDLVLLVQVDADHASNPRTRCSISGYHIFLVSSRGTFALVEWGSVRQRAAAVSTAEAELGALQTVLRKCLEVLMLLRLAGLRPRVVVCSDSTAAIAIANTGISPKIRYASCTQGISAEWVSYVCRMLGASPQKVDTVLNSADLQTKALPRGAFLLHSRFIGVQEEAVWLATTRCCGWHTSPLGVPTRCKARCYGTLCVHCAAGQPCPCWYSADTWDVRYREKAGAIPIM